MKCAVCSTKIGAESDHREFQELIVCRPCFRDLRDLTRETGGELETRAEIAHETFIDSVVGVYA